MVNSPFSIGIIGAGFIGSAIVHGFSLHANIKIYDKFKEGYDTLEDTVKNSEILFFGIPTPMFEDNGDQDLSILETAISDVHNEILKLRKIGDVSRKIAVIKSTVLPGTNEMLQHKYPEIIMISSPEFLTARNNRLDFICASRHIFGGENVEALDRVVELFKYRFGNSVPMYTTDWKTSEMVKYSANCFFAVKVNYFNFIYDLCQRLDINYEDVKDMVLADNRISRSHCDVPGHDGGKNFSGSCFPKDISALVKFSKNVGVCPKIIEAAWNQNLEDRPEKDWEKLPGVLSKRGKK